MLQVLKCRGDVVVSSKRGLFYYLVYYSVFLHVVRCGLQHLKSFCDLVRTSEKNSGAASAVITEYSALESISLLCPSCIAIAPPLPPSPSTVVIVLVLMEIIFDCSRRSSRLEFFGRVLVRVSSYSVDESEELESVLLCVFHHAQRKSVPVSLYHSIVKT